MILSIMRVASAIYTEATTFSWTPMSTLATSVMDSMDKVRGLFNYSELGPGGGGWWEGGITHDIFWEL